MIIGDNRNTSFMNVNTVSKNIPSQLQKTNTTTNSNIFASVINQLLMEMELQSSSSSSSQSGMDSFLPDMAMLMNSSTNGNPLSTQDLFNLDSIDSNQLNQVAGLDNPMDSLDNQSGTTDSSDPLSFQSIDPEKLNQVLGGKLTGMGDVFVRAGQQFNINPALLTAIAQHESGNGKSPAANVKNNIAGMMGINGLKSYSSVEASIMDMAQNLSKNYLGEGLNSISQIGAKYAPIGASNDPTGLNNNWVKGVTSFFDNLVV